MNSSAILPFPRIVYKLH